MNIRHWFRRDVLIPAGLLLAFGYLLYRLAHAVQQLPVYQTSSWLPWLLNACYVLYGLLAVVTVRHILSTYALERFDPGDPASLQRLRRMLRYQLMFRVEAQQDLLQALMTSLGQSGYVAEAHNPAIGTVMVKARRWLLIPHTSRKRVILMDMQPINVLRVDQQLRDSIRYIRNQSREPSTRNCVVIITRLADSIEVTSAAAGIVNFLGRYQGGALGAMLLDGAQSRLYYPIDQTTIPFRHRLFAFVIRRRLINQISGGFYSLMRQTKNRMIGALRLKPAAAEQDRSSPAMDPAPRRPIPSASPSAEPGPEVAPDEPERNEPS